MKFFSDYLTQNSNLLKVFWGKLILLRARILLHSMAKVRKLLMRHVSYWKYKKKLMKIFGYRLNSKKFFIHWSLTRNSLLISRRHHGCLYFIYRLPIIIQYGLSKTIQLCISIIILSLYGLNKKFPWKIYKKLLFNIFILWTWRVSHSHFHSFECLAGMELWYNR